MSLISPNFDVKSIIFFSILAKITEKALIDEGGGIITRNSVFYCQLLPVGRQMSMENSISNYF